MLLCKHILVLMWYWKLQQQNQLIPWPTEVAVTPRYWNVFVWWPHITPSSSWQSSSGECCVLGKGSMRRYLLIFQKVLYDSKVSCSLLQNGDILQLLKSFMFKICHFFNNVVNFFFFLNYLTTLPNFSSTLNRLCNPYMECQGHIG